MQNIYLHMYMLYTILAKLLWCTFHNHRFFHHYQEKIPMTMWKHNSTAMLMHMVEAYHILYSKVCFHIRSASFCHYIIYNHNPPNHLQAVLWYYISWYVLPRHYRSTVVAVEVKWLPCLGTQRKLWKWSNIIACFNVGYKNNNK